MKKIFICSVVILSLFVGRAFADGDTSIRVQSLINKGLFKNKLEIMSLASKLSPSEKESLIDRNRIVGYFPMYLNSGLGFGIGSFIAKDYIAGAIHCSIDVACNVIMITMFALYAKSTFGLVEGRNGFEEVYQSAKKYLISGIGIALALIVNRIAQVISLTVHINRYNNTLAEVFAGASSQNNNGRMAIVPIIDEDRVGLGLSFAIPNRKKNS